MNATYSSFHVLCLGNALIDAFLSLHDANMHCYYNEQEKELCVKAGEKILLDRCDFLVGGNAANVAVGLSRLGLRPSLVAELGDDEFAAKIVNTLTKEHVDLSYSLRTPNAASSFAIGINFKGDRTLFVEHVTRHHEFAYSHFSGQWVYLTSLGNEWKTPYAELLDFVAARGLKLAYNPGSHQMEAGYEGNRLILKHCHILFVNKEEAIRLADGKWQMANGSEESEDVNGLLQTLQAMGPKIVVITDGKNGSYVIDEKGNEHKLSAYPGEPIERTGAGDSYAAGFLAAHIYGKSIEEAMAWGAINAASVIQKVGSQAGLLSKEDIESKINK